MPVPDPVYAGTLLTLTATFENEAGVPTDPSTVSLTWTIGTYGVAATTWVYQGAGSITRTSTGVYVAELDTTGAPGNWLGQWVGTGACQVAQGFAFTVLPLPAA